MPNWCEGNIRFRGKQKDIKRFLMNEIVSCRYEGIELGTVTERPEIKDDGFLLTIRKTAEHGWIYINNTRRHFLPDNIEVWLSEDDEEEAETIVCIDGFKAAWSFEYCDAWKDFAKQYNIDVKMTGYERGMMFSQIKTILRDGTVKEEIKEYETWEDWAWNCPQPNNGG